MEIFAKPLKVGALSASHVARAPRQRRWLSFGRSRNTARRLCALCGYMQSAFSSCDLPSPRVSAKTGLEPRGTLSAAIGEFLVTPLSRIAARHLSEPCPDPLSHLLPAGSSFHDVSYQILSDSPRNDVSTAASALLMSSESSPHDSSGQQVLQPLDLSPPPSQCSALVGSISLPPLFILSCNFLFMLFVAIRCHQHAHLP
jgi:hypothetical protein